MSVAAIAIGGAVGLGAAALGATAAVAVGAGVLAGTTVLKTNAADAATRAQVDATNRALSSADAQYQSQVGLAQMAGEELKAEAGKLTTKLDQTALASRNATIGGLDSANATMQNTLDLVNQLYSGEAAQWDEIFGPVVENLGTFYKNLTPDTFSSTALQMQQQEFQYAQEQVQKQFAQRGITGGAQQLIDTQMQLDNARARANIRKEAPLTVASAQQDFVKGMSDIKNPWTQLVATTELSKGQQQANTALGKAQAEATYQGQLATSAATGYEATRSAIETAANVQSRASANLAQTQQQMALAQGQIAANQAKSQADTISSVVGAGLNLYGQMQERELLGKIYGVDI